MFVVNNFRKYSVLYYGDKVHYISISDDDYPLKKLDKNNPIFDKNSRAIIRNKEYENISQKYDIEILQKRRKYSLVKFKAVK